MSSPPFGIVSGTFRSFINGSDFFLYLVLFLCSVAIVLIITKFTGKSLDENLEIVKEGLSETSIPGNSPEFLKSEPKSESKQYYEKFKNFFKF